MYHIIANTIIVYAGLNEHELALHPEDKHLFRLATLISLEKCYKLVAKLGLPDSTWDYIHDTTRNSLTDMKFQALCAWKGHKQRLMGMPSFKEIAEALDKVDCHNHVLCQVGNNHSHR